MINRIICVLAVFSSIFQFQFGLVDVYYEQQDSFDYYEDIILIRQWNSVTDEERYYFDSDVKAAAVGLSVDDFEFFRDVVECESVGGDNFEDKVLVACTIINRVNDGRFGDSLFEILTRPGQFLCVTHDEDTDEYHVGRGGLQSEWAIVEAYRRNALGTVPSDMLYFNSVGFDKYKYDYAYVGGNYYSTETPNEFTILNSENEA